MKSCRGAVVLQAAPTHKEVIFLILDITLKGGVERFVANMASLVAKEGYKVKIYSYHKTFEEVLYDLPADVPIVYLSNFRFHPRFYKITTLIGSIRLVLRSRQLSNNCTFISTFPIITIILSVLSRGLLKKVIASEHSTYSSHPAWIRFLRILSYRHVKAVVTQTRDGSSSFRAAGLAVETIPNPCTDFSDTEQWTTTPSQRSKFNTFKCLTVARFEVVKQLEHFIDVARIVHKQRPKIQFELVGGGPLDTWLHKLAAGYSMDDYFTIAPPRRAIDEFYSQAAVYVITSKSEAFPMTMIEALSFGVPVLAYDRLVGPSEVVANGVNGYLCKQDTPSDLAEKIIMLADRPELYLSLCQGALRSARTYRQEEVIRDWMKIL